MDFQKCSKISKLWNQHWSADADADVCRSTHSHNLQSQSFEINRAALFLNDVYVLINVNMPRHNPTFIQNNWAVHLESDHTEKKACVRKCFEQNNIRKSELTLYRHQTTHLRGTDRKSSSVCVCVCVWDHDRPLTLFWDTNLFSKVSELPGVCSKSSVGNI